MTEGVIAVMKALEIAVVVNNASTEGEVMAEVLGKDRNALMAKVSKLEKGASSAKTVMEGKYNRIAALETQVAEVQKAL